MNDVKKRRFAIIAAFLLAILICLFTLPSCGDDLCERATDRLHECSGGYLYDLCSAISACGECKSEGSAYAKCIEEADTCADVTNGCDTEGREWAACISSCY